MKQRLRGDEAQGADDLYFRLSVILRLLQTSATQGVSVADPLRRQLDAVSRLARSSADIASSLAMRTRDVACAISALEEGSKLTKWVENASAFLEILPPDETVLLRSRLTVVSQFVETVQSLHESLRTTRMSRSDFAEWWRETVRRAGITQWQAGCAIFAEVEVWPRVAQGIDPGSYAACAARLMACRAQTATLALGEYSESYYFEEALRLDPSCVVAMEGLARLHDQQGEYHAAWDWYRRALDCGSVHPVTYNGYARIAASETQLPFFDTRAAWAAERAVAAMPVAEFWDTLAQVRERQGDISGALVCAQEALRDDDSRVDYQQRFQRLSQLKGHTTRMPPESPISSGSTTNDSGGLLDDPECDEKEPSGVLLNRNEPRLILDDLELPSSDSVDRFVEDMDESGGDGFLLYPPRKTGDDTDDEDPGNR